MTEIATGPALDREGAIAAGGQTLLGFWLEELLMEHLPLSDDLSEEQKELWIRAARLTIEELAPEGTGVGARLQALHFVCAHGAALDYQSQALSGRLPPAARTIAQRLANQLMTITSRQLTVLTRIETERRRAKEAELRLEQNAWKQTWQRETTCTRALADGMDRFLRDTRAMEAALSGQPPDIGAPDIAAARSAAGTAVATAAPAPPAPEAPLSRQQRRALERQERKAARRLAAAGAEAVGLGGDRRADLGG
jgi:hypothetical protein